MSPLVEGLLIEGGTVAGAVLLIAAVLVRVVRRDLRDHRTAIAGHVAELIARGAREADEVLRDRLDGVKDHAETLHEATRAVLEVPFRRDAYTGEGSYADAAATPPSGLAAVPVVPPPAFADYGPLRYRRDARPAPPAPGTDGVDRAPGRPSRHAR